MKHKTINRIYWTFTIIFCLGMLFSGISELVGTEEGNEVITKLGYPLYINAILGVAKVLGVIVLLQTKFKAIKEWAYAGFTFDIIGASASYALNGDGLSATLVPLPFFIVLMSSYISWKKIETYGN